MYINVVYWWCVVLYITAYQIVEKNDRWKSDKKLFVFLLYKIYIRIYV